MFNKKKNLGFQTKPRTRKELEDDYGNHAFQIGHKTRILKTKRDFFDSEESRILGEVSQHHEEMGKILQEMTKYPAKDPDKETRAE